jgi:hypothetical protein
MGLIPMRSSLYTGLWKAAFIRLLMLFACMDIFFLSAVSQSTNISGIVNSYYQVVEVIPSKACVRLNTVSGLARNQKVLVIQMKGASVVTTNNSSFGDTTSLNNAGNYEVAIICAIDGDSVFMFHDFLNNYTVADKVQLVKFAEYYAAVATDTVKALPWNNSTGTGGVIAISVSTDLTLNAPIIVDSSGFRGGSYALSDGTCFNSPFSANGYIYDASASTPQNGAYKGESVYTITVAGQTGGRGAPANGGGGGNNHNNGGGGGANLSAGGRGGGNSSNVGCVTNLRGEAGKALSSWSGKKIFFGGGGGAGHSNSSLSASNGGGNGGGIIFIHANNIIGNGYQISATGGTGGNAISDGASGGGGGGSIVLDINSYSGSLTVQTNGGKGGDENDDAMANRCYGAGGGGSGGVIYFTGSVPAITISTAGGVAGSETSRDAGCNAIVAALNGSNGTTVSSYTMSQATDSSSYCLSIGPLPVGLIYFKVSIAAPHVKLEWKMSNPALVKNFIVEKWSGARWNSLQTIVATNSTLLYNYIDQHPLAGNNLYRLRIVWNNYSVSLSPIRQVILKFASEKYLVYPNPTINQFVITGELSLIVIIKLSTVTGTVCWERKLMTNGRNLVVDLPALPMGTYSLHINDVVKKLVISK